MSSITLRHQRATAAAPAAIVLVAVLAAGVLAGCSGSSSSAAPSAGSTTSSGAIASPGTTSTVAGGASSGSSDPSGTPSAAGSVAESAGSAAGSVAGPAPAQGGQLPVLGTGDANDDGVPLTVAVNEFRVSGQLLQLTWTASNTSTSDQSWTVNTFFSNQVVDPTGDAAQSKDRASDNYSVDGVYLLDTAGAKRYLVARDQTGVCACTTGLGNARVATGASLTFTATFKAPPAEVSTMRVVIPHVRPFDLAVQR